MIQNTMGSEGIGNWLRNSGADGYKDSVLGDTDNKLVTSSAWGGESHARGV